MSSFGRIFKVTTFGESHSYGVGGIIEGFPSCFKINEVFIQSMLDRRKPGQSSITTSRKESDKIQILSGLENNITLGTPISFLILNENTIKKDYSNFDQVPRPGHADLTYLMKYSIKSESGGGRSSARETVSRVAAGAFAENYLSEKLDLKIMSWVSAIGNIEISDEFNKNLLYENQNEIDKFILDDMGTYDLYKSKDNEVIYWNYHFKKSYDSNGNEIEFELKNNQILSKNNLFEFNETITIRCPHIKSGISMINLIKEVKLMKDSIGGIITCVIKNVPQGLGEPCFDKIEALLAHAMLSIPATKGFEIGSGFQGVKMLGSQHNDLYIKNEKNNSKIKIKPETNNSGGIIGGITNGENIYFKVAFKPVSTIGLPQKTVDLNGNEVILEAAGRHDPCVLPRASPIVEAMAGIVILDCYLLQKSIENNKKN